MQVSFLLFSDFSDYISAFGYLGIFLFFTTIDQFTFIPEEITLVSIGYLSAQGIFNPIVAGVIAVISFITVDCIYFFLVGSGSKWTKKIMHKINHRRLDELKEKFKHNFPKTLLVICFIPRMRLFAPIVAGLLKTSIKKFLLYDAIGLALLTSIYVSIGFFFHKGLSTHLGELEKFKHYIFIAAMLVLFLLIFIFIRRSKKEGHKPSVHRK